MIIPNNHKINFLFDFFRASAYKRNLMVDVHVQFREDQIYPLIRKSALDFYIFLSNVGGIFGLLMGFSILTAVEIIYFSTLRVAFRNWKQQQFNNDETVVRNRNGILGFMLKILKATLKPFQNYFTNSSLHSAVYIANRHLVEKLFWLICFALSVVSCAISSRNLYRYMKANPIVISISEESRSIQSIQFPAVTLIGDYGMLEIFSNMLIGMTAFFYREYFVDLHIEQGNFDK